MDHSKFCTKCKEAKDTIHIDETSWFLCQVCWQVYESLLDKVREDFIDSSDSTKLRKCKCGENPLSKCYLCNRYYPLHHGRVIPTMPETQISGVCDNCYIEWEDKMIKEYEESEKIKQQRIENQQT